MGFVPPSAAVGCEAFCRVWENMSVNVARPFLKPTVFTFAMLLPMTSIISWWFLRPETPAKSEVRNAIVLPSCVVLL